MKERPILLNAEMVRAVLDGRKTQTRRIMKVQPDSSGYGLRFITESFNNRETGKYFWSQSDGCGINKPRSKPFSCPFGAVGDLLWVRETFACGLSTKSTLAYRATHRREDLEDGFYDIIKWRPSIHMPRWASRITLEITGVRVERLASISNEDAAKEGYPANPEPYGGQMDQWLWFRQLWDGIYPEQSFKHNPWVWVIEFKRVEGEL